MSWFGDYKGYTYKVTLSYSSPSEENDEYYEASVDELGVIVDGCASLESAVEEVCTAIDEALPPLIKEMYDVL